MAFDPDADALVEGKTTDFSGSIQDTDPVDTMTIPTAVKVARFSVEETPGADALRLILLILGFVIGGVVKFKIPGIEKHNRKSFDFAESSSRHRSGKFFIQLAPLLSVQSFSVSS